MVPVVRFVLLKTRMMAQRAELVERRSALLQQMRDAVALKDVLTLVPQIDQLEVGMDRASAPFAFMGKGDEQWAFCMAADYADEWA